MNWLKNFFYDKNDILIALIILVLAAGVILWRVNVIMTYPEELVAAAHEAAANDGPITTPYDRGDSDATTSDSAVGTTDSGISGEGTDGPEVYAVYVNPGENLTNLGNVLVGCGFFESADEFLTYVNAAGAASKIQMGNHFIPAGATKEECIDYLCEFGV
ncbi:MAG: hypothetical protein J5622_02500 [Firmicutes bacterium]|nr:hypothetical protein [Bacillota bacterium]MBR6014794.1 hypothetical protein [Bacillota bacterium]